jgi:lipoprotein-releasing system permease protein
MTYEWQIGWRLVRAAGGPAGRGGFVSFIAAVAMLGLALGVAALIVVLSVVNGFQREVRDRMLDVVPHVELQTTPGDALLDSPALQARLRAWPGVRALAPVVQLPALLGRDDTLRAVLVQGIAPAQSAQVSALIERLDPAVLGTLTAGSMHIVPGRALAKALAVKAGDSVTLVQPGDDAAPRLRPLPVGGAFASGHYEFDDLLALMHIDDAAALAGDQGARGLALRLDDAQQAPRIAAELRALLPPGVAVSDWTRTNRAWFESVQIQKRMIALILALIVAVAAFNLTSMMVMTVTDRRADIAILRTLGASPASVMAIFMIQGAASGVVGTLGGLLLGLGLAFELDRIVPLIEKLAGRPLLDAQVYLIDHMPSDPRAGEVATIAATALALAVLATVYPSWRASRVDPAEALRGES